IFISAVHLTDLDRLKGYQRGAVDYISVPVNPELLRARVSIFAELHRKNRQLENLNQQLRLLSTTLINMQDDERRRIARELHDGLGQDLVAATMLIDRITSQMPPKPAEKETALQVSQVIHHALQHVRSMSYLLHPPLLDEIGLCSALRWYVEGAGKRTDVNLSIDIDPPEFPRMEPQLETALFRIVQEALTNVWRHSEASEASVTLEHKDRKILLTVRDDGKGIGENVQRFRAGSIGVGLGGMMHRAKEMGGEMRIRNANPGTVVEVSVPAKQAQSGGGAGAFAEELAHPNAAN
ncbi:MAG: ATP-binding response regulator, partial [Candidatus Acidiferrales bacterium]